MANKFTVEKSKIAPTTLSKGGILSGLSAPSAAPAASTSKYDTSEYDQADAAYTARIRADAETAKKEKTAEYGEQARQAYISRMQNEKKLSENLARVGIRGGATETANLNLQANYENNRNKINSQKMNDLKAIDRNADDEIFKNKQALNADKLAYIHQREAEERQIAETKRQEQWQAQQAAKQNRETRYAATMSGYDTVAKCDKKIKQIQKWKKTNPAKYKEHSWKLTYLRAQRATVKAKNKKK